MENNFLDNESLVNEITYIIVNARNNVIKNVNNELINAYWNIGRIIVEDELKIRAWRIWEKSNYLHYRRLLQINLGKDFLEQTFKI